MKLFLLGEGGFIKVFVTSPPAPPSSHFIPHGEWRSRERKKKGGTRRYLSSLAVAERGRGVAATLRAPL